MSDENAPKDEIKDEFSRFGENFKEAFDKSWSPEDRKEFQDDISDGLNQIGTALSDFVKNFSASETGQKIISEVDEFGDRLRSGEVEAKAKEGLVTVLKKVNSEIEKVSDRLSQDEEPKQE